jgi:hypothetical protein
MAEIADIYSEKFLEWWAKMARKITFYQWRIPYGKIVV